MGIAVVGTRSLLLATCSWLSPIGGALGLTATLRAGTVVVFSMSRIVESVEDIEVSVERLEGVDGSIVGEGGKRTSATSSESVSVTTVPAISTQNANSSRGGS